LRHLITTFRPPHVSNWFPRRDYPSFLSSNGKHATRFTLGPYRDRCRSRGLWLGSRSLGWTPSDVGIASQKRGGCPRILHFKNQQSSLDNHQSTPCAPPRVSGCLKVVKKAGTVPGFSSVLGFLSAPRQPRFCDRIRYRRREQCKHSETPLRGVFPRFLVSTWQVDMIPSAHGRQLQSKLAKNECSLDKKSSYHFSKPLIGQ
jgi:hypothetical protein